jgi:hypothetical protein
MSNETQTVMFGHGAVTQVGEYCPTMHLPATQPSLTTARLLIHDGGMPGKPSLPGHETLMRHLRRLGTLYLARRRPGDADGTKGKIPLSLQINNLQGCPVFTNANAGALTSLPLPAGTYHVMASWGCINRCYTLALAQGASFDLYLDLYLRPAPP